MFKTKLKKIIDKYGEDAQIAKALEELVELSEVLVKYLNKGELDGDHLLEEMVDVDVMMAQLMIIFDLTAYDAQDIINKAPSIDIVRCKECKHWHKNDRGIIYCDRITYGFNHIDMDFCSYGERREP